MEERDTEGLMVPPWVMYPAMPRASIGWRMGYGEEYWDDFRVWWLTQTAEVHSRVQTKYAEPPDWSGFYESLGH